MPKPRWNFKILIMAPLLIIALILSILNVSSANSRAMSDYESSLKINKTLSEGEFKLLKDIEIPQNASSAQAEALKKLNKASQEINPQLADLEKTRKAAGIKYQYLKDHPPQLKSYADYVILLMINIIVLSVHVIRVVRYEETKPVQ